MYIIRKAVVFISLVQLLALQSRAQSNSSKLPEGEKLEIAAFGELKSWLRTPDPLGSAASLQKFNANSSPDSSDIGIFWWESRDVERIEVGSDPTIIPLVQYWQDSWPETPPKMPSKEDLEDDPWQGKWITASTDAKTTGGRLILSFKPLAKAENKFAERLPGTITYRRTLKIRLLYPSKHAPVESLKVYSVSKQKTTSFRVEFLDSSSRKKKLQKDDIEMFNGSLKSISGLVATIYSSTEALPGSNDETVVTLNTPKGRFSFSIDDLEKNPIYVPAYSTYITRSDDPKKFSRAIVDGQKIRERIPSEPEQTYDRAKKEIPALDPTNRVSGGNIDLPLASDANWQKFAVQWGGNILIDKEETKAYDKELARCNWPGANIRWSLGTGLVPDYKRTKENCRMSVLNDYLPVIQSEWTKEGLNYREEAFTVLLNGPLSPDDPNRNEQTPAILMVGLTMANPSMKKDTSHLWLSANEGINGLVQDGGFLLDEVDGKQYIRCYSPSLKNASKLTTDKSGSTRIVHQQIVLGPNSSQTVYFYFPFVGDLTATQQQDISGLNYEVQKTRVVDYWRAVVTKASIFNVPERKFNEMSRAVIPHIRMSVTKEPNSGLYMVPAAAFSYQVYPNEAVFQTLLLDRVGDYKTAGDYLNTFMALQGSKKLPGSFTGDQKDVFFGTRVDSLNDWTEENGYNMHHGTVLWGLARHYLYSRDLVWLKKAAPHMIRAAKWIIDQRAQTKVLDERGNKVLHYGLLPAGVLEDVHDWQFWYATNAFACLGMESMADAFEKAGLPMADTFRGAAKAYHDDIRRSFERCSERCPVVKLRNNTYVPYVPSRAHQRFRLFGHKKSSYYDRYKLSVYPTLRLSATREVLYGPVVLLKAGLISADEQMADWVLDDWEDNLTLSSSSNFNVHGWVDDEYWFSRGGMVFQANLQNPVSIYLLRNEIPATIRGLYDNFVSCLYPDINAHTEEYREWGRGSGPFYKCPDEARFISQVCDLLVVEKNDELWLAAGTPRRWLEAGQNIELNKGSTAYGELSYSLHSGKLPGTIEANIDLPENRASKVILYVRSPDGRPIKKVLINGKESQKWNAVKESIEIPQTEKKVQVLVYYR